MNLLTLFTSAGLTIPTAIDATTEITGITSRSEEVKEGYLFVALQGLHCDGNDFIAQVMQRKAVLAISDRQKGEMSEFPVHLVEDARLALSKLCDAFYGHPTKKMTVIGVTGTNGKTSTVHFLQHLFRCAGKKVGICSTVGDQIDGQTVAVSSMTTPDPEELYARLRQFADAGVEIAVLEVSSHALALQKVAPIDFEFGLLTNLTQDHLDFHKTMEAYAQAKAKLCAQSDTMILPYEVAFSDLFLHNVKKAYHTFSVSNDAADFTVKNPRVRPKGICYEFLGKEMIFRINTPLFGNFTYDNSLLAASCAVCYGIDFETIQRAFATMPAVTGRLEEISLDAPFRVFCDYAHTPDALARALNSLRPIVEADGRLIALFGCGGDRDSSKRGKMGEIAARLADFLIVTEDNNRKETPEDILGHILLEIPKEKPHILVRYRRDAIDYAIQNARENDVILLAGKGHERYELQADGKHPFDEIAVVKSALQRRKSTS